MDTNKAFKTLGLEPTTDYKVIRKVYREQYKKLQRNMARARSKGDSLDKLDNKLQTLNQALNHFEIRKNNLEQEVKIAKFSKEREEEIRAKHIPSVADQLLQAELGGLGGQEIDNINQNFMTSIKKSISINWKEMDIPVESDEVTLGVYLRGGNIMIGDELVDIPKGFEGVYVRTLKSGELQFISIKIKSSVTFELKNTGDLVLKTLPAKHEVKEDGVDFVFSGTNFHLNKESFLKEKNKVKIFDTGINKYGSRESIKLEVHPGTEAYSLV